MRLLRWDDLPKNMKNDAVLPYYNVLAKKRTSLFFKRAFDVVLSAILLIILSPLFVILAVAIKLDSKGSVFFKQTRITQYGRKFRIYKFRTMIENADSIGSSVTLKNDRRITGVGQFLRKTRLDEIPQLINVLLGEMTFVGTRPEIEKYVCQYTPEMMATLLLPAGVTSLASIRYKDESAFLGKSDNADRVYISRILPEKMRYNLSSMKNFSFFADIKVIFMTLMAVLG